jgi:N-acetylmuramoyl-L-alanine amidase
VWVEPQPVPVCGSGLIAPIWHGSANFGVRRACAVPELVVLHYTAMDSAEAALARLCDPEFEVSAHYLIGEDGTCWQMVADEMRAWHAGAGQWGGRGDVNSRSIGIELANRGTHPFSEPQMAVLEALLARILAEHAIAPKGVIGHSDMAPARKFDPGARFDWCRLARSGVSVWSDGASDATGVSASVSSTWADHAARFGYGFDACDAGAVLQAFRDRFRPGVVGPVDEDDVAIMADLATRFPAG